MSAAPALLTVAGCRLEVEHLTAASIRPAPTVVLLHEALGSVSHWRDFPVQLAARCHCDVLLYSRPGHGQSDGPAEARTAAYFHRQSLEVLPALLEHFSIASPVLLGHSEGAAIALICAAHRPQQVSALILESPILHLEPAAAAGMAAAEQAWQHTDLRQRLARHHRDPDAVFAAWLTIRRQDSLLSLPLRDHLPPVTCPLLVLQGDRDEYATSAQAEALAELAPQMQLETLADTGHTPHRERQQQVLDRIAVFLNAVEGETGTRAGLRPGGADFERANDDWRNARISSTVNLHPVLALPVGLLALVALPAHAQTAAAGNCSLTIHVTGFRNSTGVLGAELFTSSKGWPEKVDDSFRHASFPIDGDHATAKFDHLPAGRYGVVVLHDENKNEKLDRTFLQVPKEGFGFANNPKVLLAAPAMEKATVAVACPATTTEVRLIYK